jgi:hypothetical protein
MSSRRSSRAGLPNVGGVDRSKLRVNDAGNICTGPHMLPIDKTKRVFTRCKYHILIPDNLYSPNTEELCYGNNDRNLR